MTFPARGPCLEVGIVCGARKEHANSVVVEEPIQNPRVRDHIELC